MIELRTLGPLDLRTTDGRELGSVLAQPRRLALLIYLALARPSGFHRRDRLLTVFWGEQDQEHGRAALTRAIYFLRRALGEDVIVSRADEIVVERQTLWCDAVAFAAAVDEGRWSEALELYRDDLLPGFFISDGPEFEHWLELERAHLRQRAAYAAEQLAEVEEARGNLPLAVQHARRASALSPYDERALRRLLHLLDRSGDRVGAVHAYERFAAHITKELELDPAPETLALVEAIRVRVETIDQLRTQNANTTEQPRVSAETAPGAFANKRWLPSRLAVGVLVVGLLSAVVVSVAMRRSGKLDANRVFVASVDNPSGDPRLNRLAVYAGDMIVQGLAQIGPIVTLPVTREEDQSRGSNRAERIAELVSSARRGRAAFIVYAVMHVDSDDVRIHAQILDTWRGQVALAISPISAPISNPTAALTELRQRTMGAIAILNDRRFASWFRHAAAPPTFEAFQEFAKGYALRLGGQPHKALEYFQRAFELDSTFTWALMEKAVAYTNLIQPRMAYAIADFLNRRRDSLLPLQRHFLDYFTAFRAEDQVGAHEAMVRAAELAPERFLYGVGLTGYWVNRPRVTIDAMKRLAATPTFDGGSAGYWWFLTGAYHQLGHHRKELSAARRARQHHPDDLSIFCLEIRALAALGLEEEVEARLDTIYSYPPQKRTTFGAALVELAPELEVHGMHATAQQVYERAITWYRTRPPDDTASWDFQWEFGQALYQAGHFDEAEPHFRTAAAMDTTQVDAYSFIGVIAALRGDSATARQVLRNLDARRNVVSRPGEEVVLGKARISAALGDQENALRYLIDAIGGQGVDYHAEPAYAALRSNKRFREFIRPKV